MGRHVNADAVPDDAQTELETAPGEHDARHASEPESEPGGEPEWPVPAQSE